MALARSGATIWTSRARSGLKPSGRGGGHDNLTDHRGMNRAVIAPITDADCHRLAQRARRERAGVDGTVIEHEVMGHGIPIAPHDDLVGPDCCLAWIEGVWAVYLRDIDRHDVRRSRRSGCRW